MSTMRSWFVWHHPGCRSKALGLRDVLSTRSSTRKRSLFFVPAARSRSSICNAHSARAMRSSVSGACGSVGVVGGDGWAWLVR
jgi:hypothetical protein